MPSNWSKGFTKATHPSVRKISETMKRKKIDNFKQWREKMEKEEKFHANYLSLKKSGDLAELIGVILGDGNIEKFPRTERLTILSNANNKGFVKRYIRIVHKTFAKPPTVKKVSYENAIRISLYQKQISKRLNIPTGSRKSLIIKTPAWIFKNKEFLKRFLRGLYEAEGCFCVHENTYTYKFLFSNRNHYLLQMVYDGMKKLGFHPHPGIDKVQISKKKEVYEAINLINFRKYD